MCCSSPWITGRHKSFLRAGSEVRACNSDWRIDRSSLCGFVICHERAFVFPVGPGEWSPPEIIVGACCAARWPPPAKTPFGREERLDLDRLRHRLRQRHIDHVFGDEPELQLVAPDQEKSALALPHVPSVRLNLGPLERSDDRPVVQNLPVLS